jgi:hypothetical protein
VDAEDYEWLMRYKWHTGYTRDRTRAYAYTHDEHNRSVLMHRLIMKPPPGKVVDHKNGNGLDNRRCNLRICNQAQNLCNRGPFGKTCPKFKGVSPRGDKWVAGVGKEYLGLFNNDVEAAKARDRRAREVYGEHAWLNFPPGSPEYEEG